MELKYKEWIAKYLSENNPKMQCENASRLMMEVFPELVLIRGSVITINAIERTHWWCETPDKEIIDATETQFGSIVKYYPLDETLPEPSGKCLHCGEFVYDSSQFCSSTCRLEDSKRINTPYNIGVSQS